MTMLGHTDDLSPNQMIAIIGMAGRFPGAKNVAEFWHNLSNGIKSIRFFSNEELLAAGVNSNLLKDPNYVKAGIILEDADLFDAPFFGFTPREAETMDPQTRLFLQCAWEALEDAAYDPTTYKGVIGLFAGKGPSNYLTLNLATHPDLLELVGNTQVESGNYSDALATMVAYKLDLKGPSVSVQTFCSTSMVSLHLACQSLLAYECDMALAGGAAFAHPQGLGYMYQEGGVLSPDGECRTFDARGRGTVVGSGIGTVVVKRLEDALQAGDHIYAVIRGSAMNNDGITRVSYAAPGLNGQASVIASALGNAAIDPETIRYIEAHGTGTAMGDAVEMAALIEVFKQSGRKKHFCALGSVKPNVGHLDRASGVTGLIKTVLALQHKMLPPSLNFERSSPDIDLGNSPFYVNTKLIPWPKEGTLPRRAGVNSFGMGGTNTHVVLEEAPDLPPSSPSRPYQLLVLSAKTESALEIATSNLATYLGEHPSTSLADVAYTLQVGRATFNHRRVVVCQDAQDGAQALAMADPRRVWTTHQTHAARPVVFMFPGVGDHYTGVAQDLYKTEPVFRGWVDRCCDLLEPHLGLNLRDVLYPHRIETEDISAPASDGPDLRRMLGWTNTIEENLLQQTAVAQPAVFVVEYALAQLLMGWGIKPKAMIGYSLGEYVAACLAGVLSLEDALMLVAKRAALIQSLEAGGMLAVPLSAMEVRPFLGKEVALAAAVGPMASILAGPVEAVTAVQRRLEAQDIACRLLPTSHAFHSPMMMPIVSAFAELLQTITLHTPKIPYIANVTGRWLTNQEATDPAYWTKHLCQTVQFESGLQELLQDQNALFLEVGPGQALSSFVKQHPACSREQLHQVLPTLPHSYDSQHDTAFLLNTLGKVWLAGGKIDWSGFYQHEQRYRISLPTYPFARLRYWIEPNETGYTPRLHPIKSLTSHPTGKKPDVGDWFYRPVWREKPLSGSSKTADATSPWLIFTDKTGLGEQIADFLTQQGHVVVRVRAGDQFTAERPKQFTLRPDVLTDYTDLLYELKEQGLLPKRFIHLWSVTQGDVLPGMAGFMAAQQVGYYAVINLVRALSEQNLNDPLEMVVVSNNTHSVTGTEALYPEKATLLGVARAILQECLTIACRMVDLDVPTTGTWITSEIVQQLVADFTTPTTDLETAYRHQERYARTYESVHLESPADTPLRQKGTYLITGGLGGVGLVLARHLAEALQANVILTGRHGLPNKNEWERWLATHNEADITSLRIRKVQEIESLGGTVLSLAADVADKQQMKQAIATAKERFGDIHGVIHAAGVSDNAYASIQMITPQQCELNFQPKVYGLYVLEEVLAGETSLDFCMLFSSISAVLGGIGFVGYAAANIFMDAFVHQHNRTTATKWISVSWDTWQLQADRHAVLGKTIAEYEMTPSEGVNAFRRVLGSQGNAHLVNSTGDLDKRIREWVMLESLQDEAATAVSVISGNSRPHLPNDYVPASSEYEQKITAVWQELLGIEQVGIHDNFFDLGGNSLIGLQVIARLKKVFNTQIPVVALFEAPTVGDLARYLRPVQSASQENAQQKAFAERRKRSRRQVDHQAIAVIGMAGRFPGANTVEDFWKNLCEGVESVTFFTDEELFNSGIPPEVFKNPNYIKARPIIDDADLFDAPFFGFSPREAELTDPQHRLFLECAWEALEIAGYDPKTYPGLIGLFAGRNISYYLNRLIADPEFLSSLADYEAAYQLAAGNDKDALATGVAYKLNLKGPSLSVQTFCSTSLVATHLACQSLFNGECDMALAGGVSIRVPVKAGYMAVEGGMESLDGHCRTFDAQATGTLFGDGVAIVVLKRLEDALEDGDYIYGCIKGSAINNDGSLKAGFTAPSVTGQAEVISVALANAGVTADQIGYIEAHGTATPIGDPIEIAALTKAFRQTTQAVGYCAIGSVKTNMGHLDHAAGATGLIKSVLAIKHGLIPPNLHFQAPNPELDIETSPFYVNARLTSWQSNGRVRLAGVSSLGVGGTNAHIILEESPERRPSGTSRPWQLLLLSARTETALDTATANLAHYLRQNPAINLADTAYTLQVGRSCFEHRRMVVCQHTADALSTLESMPPGHVFSRHQPDINRPVVFMFSGVGDHYIHMTQELYQVESVFREAFNRCADYLQPVLGVNLREVLYPAGNAPQEEAPSGLDLRQMLGQSSADQSQPLQRTEIAQPLVFSIEYALTQLLETWGVSPHALIGYSLGEYTAACIAGVFSLENALMLVARRAQLIQRLPAGGMVAVSLSEQAVQPFLSEEVNLAIVNGPTTSVLAGPPQAIAQLEAQWTERGIHYRHLDTSHAFHSQMMQPIVAEFTGLLKRIKFTAPQIPYISNVTGRWITPEEATDPGYWVHHLCQTVRFSEGLAELLQDQERILLEVGPGQSLSSFAKQHPGCKREQLSLILPTLRSAFDRQSDLAFLLGTIGKLWLAGVRLNWSGFYQKEQRHRLPLPTYPFERESYWIDPSPNLLTASAEQSASLRNNNLTEWFYLPMWEAKPLVRESVSSLASWLIFEDGEGWGEKVSQQLNQAGVSVVRVKPGEQFAQVTADLFTIRPGALADYRLLFSQLKSTTGVPSHMLHMWSVTAPTSQTTGIEGFHSVQQTGFYSLLYLAKALGDESVLDPIQIVVVSSHMQPIGDKPIEPEKATLMGPLLVIQQEYQNIRCRSVDIILPVGEDSQKDTFVEQLIEELSAPMNDVVAAYRHKERYVRSFIPQKLPGEQITNRLRPGGVYLITGALGVIGLALAEFLAREYQAKLVLTSRSGLPARHEWKEILAYSSDDLLKRRIGKIQSLEEMGAEVLVLAADASNEAQMQTVIEQTIERFGGLHGVIHGAGLTNSEYFDVVQNIREAVCEAHFAGKVQGLYVLDRVLKERELDFCFLLSSVSAVLGGLGYVAYVAANAFMDAYAHAHNQAGGTPWITVNWDTWKEEANTAAFEMTLAEGIQAFQFALSSGFNHLVNSTGDLEARLRQWVLLEGRQKKSARKRKLYARPTLPTVYKPATNEYENRITAIWQEVLGIEQIGIHDNFFDLGGNSLVGLEVIARLQQAFNRSVTPVALFEAPTVHTLARYLQPDVVEEEDTGEIALGERRRKARQGVQNKDIAIIAMNGRFPGAANVNQFWKNLCDGVESISHFSDEELLASGIDPELFRKPNYVRSRPIIEEADFFDAAFFGYSPREAELLDPQQRVLLECAWEALELAGYNANAYKGLIGAFVGSTFSSYVVRWLVDPVWGSSVSNYQVLISGADKDSLATTLSYKLNLKGPSFSVQTFCSTSLVATHLAAQSLLNGECDIALAGGVSISIPQKQGHLYEEGGMESPDGHCRTFDAKAKGTLFGDGVGLVVLKRLDEALEDGDTIHALIKGSAVNNDGSLKVGYTAPSVTGQAEAVAMAIENAGIAPETIGYIEAHGTATELGDPIEIASLTRAYRKFTDKKGFCGIGSLKTNMGHLDRASGVIGLIKAVLAVKQGIIPPTLHFESPNPEIDFANSPFYVVSKQMDWSRNGSPRRAGVNSLGMGGTNAHVIIEEPPAPRPSGPSRPWQMLLLSARTDSALDTATLNLADYLRQNPQSNLADVAYTLQVGRQAFPSRRVVVCQGIEDGLMALESLDPHRVRTNYQPDVSRPLVFMFPGVGDHYLHVAKDLYDAEPFFHQVVEQCCRILYPYLGIKLRDLLYPADELPLARSNGAGINLRDMIGKNGQKLSPAAQRLHETAVAQPVVFVIEYALARLLMAWGLHPQALIGYSLGEYVAACISGVLSLEDALKLVARRAQMIQSLPVGSMVAVALPYEAVQPMLSTNISLAAHNGKNMCVLAGSPQAIQQLENKLTSQEISYRPLDTTHAFHSSMMAPLSAGLTALVQTVRLHPPQIPYLSNVTGTWITDEQATDVAYWSQHMCQPVRFYEALEELLTNEDRVLLEVGPGQSLGSFAKQHPACRREQMRLILPTLRYSYDHKDDGAFLLTTLGDLWLLGLEPDWSLFYKDQERHRIPLPTYPFERHSFWIRLSPGNPTTRVTGSAPRSEDQPRQAFDDWFYVPVWNQKSPYLPTVPDVNETTQNSCWLLFMDTTGMGAKVAAWLQQHRQTVVTIEAGLSFMRLGETRYQIRPDVRDDYVTVLSEIQDRGWRPAYMVHLWSLTADAPVLSNEGLLTSQLNLGFYSLMALAQALGELDLASGQLSVVTSNTQPVTGDERIYPEKATIVGPCKVIPQEYPRITCRVIDVDLFPSNSWQTEALFNNLIGELTAATADTMVALRRHQRWVQTFEQVKLPPPPQQPLWMRPNGVYLVTGGLGGIGLAMARYLAQQGPVKLVLIGRSALPPHTEWSQILAREGADRGISRKIQGIQELETLGAEVLVIAADVSNEAQMRKVVQQTLARFGPIHGVVHTAGIPGVGLIQLKTPEMAAGVLTPKVAGTLVLDRVFKDMDLDFLTCFSSMNAITGGGPGQIDYAAANAFMDAYAHCYAGHQRIVSSIDWGEWQWDAWQEGLEGFSPEVQEALVATRKKYGIDFEEGSQAWNRVLSRRLPQVVVSTRDFLEIVVSSKDFNIEQILAYGRKEQEARPKYPRPTLRTSYVAPRNELEQKIANLWGEMLGIDEIGVMDNFFDLGGNSLVGLDMVVRLKRELEVKKIPAHVIYEAPSVSELAKFLSQDQSTRKVSLEMRLERGEKRRQKTLQERNRNMKR